MFSANGVKRIVRTALIAAMYFALCVALPALSFGQIQFRLSEALVLLPILMPEAAVGLAIGCLFSNLFFSPFGWLDALIGTIATLIAALLTSKCKRLAVGCIPPILLNSILVPLIWIINGSDTLYYLNFLTILASETLVVYAVALPLTYLLKRSLPTYMIRGGKRESSNEAVIKANNPQDEPLGFGFESSNASEKPNQPSETDD